MGKILAYSGIMQEQEVSWMPSYGPEMRGGTANVTVILSDDRVSSPVLQSYDTAILLNQQSMDKFEEMVKPGGLMIYDPNGITRHPERDDIRIFQVEATEEAVKMKSPITFNMVVLGAYIKVNPVVPMIRAATSLPAMTRRLVCRTPRPRELLARCPWKTCSCSG